MKRRRFITHSVIGSAAAGISGCFTGNPKTITLRRKMQDPSFEVHHQKPRGGTIETGYIGKTDIRASKFGYGAHMSNDLVPYVKERQAMIREAYDLGVTVFDVYDHSSNWPVHQYGHMGVHLKPMINDVVISINMAPKGILTVEQELQRAMMLFGRDHIDMVRCHAYDPQNRYWDHWEKLFRLKEQGYIRAVGCPIHFPPQIELVMEQFPIDYVILPYNFYHNLLWDGKTAGDMHPVAKKLRERGIGIIAMKPFGTDWFVTPLIEAGKQLDKTGEISMPQAMLRYIINSELKPDVILGGMYNLDHVYENIPAFYQPDISPEETALLEKVKTVAKVNAQAWLPDHYRFLNRHWAPDSPEYSRGTSA